MNYSWLYLPETIEFRPILWFLQPALKPNASPDASVAPQLSRDPPAAEAPHHWMLNLMTPSRVITHHTPRNDQLVGGWPTPLKNISQLGLLFPIYIYNLWKNKKCSQALTSQLQGHYDLWSGVPTPVLHQSQNNWAWPDHIPNNHNWAHAPHTHNFKGVKSHGVCCYDPTPAGKVALSSKVNPLSTSPRRLLQRWAHGRGTEVSSVALPWQFWAAKTQGLARMVAGDVCRQREGI